MVVTHKTHRIRNAIRLQLALRQGGIPPNRKALEHTGIIAPKRLSLLLDNELQPTFDELWQLAEYFQIPVQDLFSPIASPK